MNPHKQDIAFLFKVYIPNTNRLVEITTLKTGKDERLDETKKWLEVIRLEKELTNKCENRNELLKEREKCTNL